MAVAGLLVDLGLERVDRMPDAAGQKAEIAGIVLPRLAVATGENPLPALLACLQGIDSAE
jgi:hypothetical protein